MFSAEPDVEKSLSAISYENGRQEYMSFGRSSGAGGRNTLEDYFSGHRKNSYGVEGMCVTNNPNARKTG